LKEYIYLTLIFKPKALFFIILDFYEMIGFVLFLSQTD